MTLNEEKIVNLKNLYPLHFAVFENNLERLNELLNSPLKEHINQLDIHGRSPVMLATTLKHIECANILLANGADANTQNKGDLCQKIKIFLDMWLLSHEAVSLENPEYLKKVLNYRDLQRAIKTTKILIDLRESLKVLIFIY